MKRVDPSPDIRRGPVKGRSWQNWARTVRVRPQRIQVPASVASLQRAVAGAAAEGLRVKAVGAGHSFTGIAEAPEVLLDLSRLQGLVSADPGTGRVTLLAGTRLHAVPRLLAPYALAMPNLGDIDRQSIAGAVSTGTHGTGAGFGGLSTQVCGLVLIQPDGGRLSLPEGDPLLPAAALGLGALGIIAEVTLQCVPAFLLRAEERSESLETVVSGLADRVEADHFEFYWFPHTGRAATKTNTRLPASSPPAPLPPLRRWVDDSLLSNTVFRATCAAGSAIPAMVPAVNRVAAAALGGREYTDRSSRVFTQDRTVRFREMEYAVPAQNLPSAFAGLRQLVADNPHWRISFPVEVRWAAADDHWLSTAYGRDTAYIAVHRYYREDPGEYFAAFEALMLAHGGRPHWGKEHSLGAVSLAERYPLFGRFVRLRDDLDPDRVFTNAYLDRVLGP